MPDSSAEISTIDNNEARSLLDVSVVAGDDAESGTEALPPDDDGDASGPEEPASADELDELVVAELAAPVVSANAIAGMDTAAALTPKANANAPTRPT